MSTPPQPRETPAMRRAIDAITALLTRAQEAGDDPAHTARAIIVGLIGHGWRPTNAHPAPAWRLPARPPAEPGPEWQQARAQLAQRRGETESWWR